MRQIIFILSLLLLAQPMLAQENEDIVQTHRPVQFTFLYPLGTNGTTSGRYTNHLSFNLLAGYNGGLNGAEFGGFLNSIRHDVKGAQFAGFGNIVGRRTHGAQLAGFFNFTLKDVKGAQFAGFVNYAGGNSKMIQGSGFANVLPGNMEGAQLGGFANYAHSIKGLQASGFLNVAWKRVEGGQIGGFLNVAGKLKGIQIGFINYADSLESGVPIGFLSFVRKGGYKTLEIGGNETLHGTMALKLGVRRFYNIFGVGIRPQQDQLSWAVGYGVGTNVDFTDKFSLSLEGVAWHLNEGEAWTDELNLLNRINLTANLQLAPRFTIYAGPSLNILVSEFENSEGTIGSSLVPWQVYDQLTNNGRTSVVVYPGFKAGIRL